MDSNLDSPESNEPLNPQQIPLLRETISGLQKNKEVINHLITKEEAKIAVSTATVAHLQSISLLVKQGMGTQEQLLKALIRSRGQIEGTGTPGPDWRTQSRAKELCQEIANRVEVQISDCLESVKCQISKTETNLVESRGLMQRIQTELYGEQLMQAVSLNQVSSGKVHKKSIEEDICLLKRALSRVKMVPRELWAKIFRIRVDEDMDGYFKNPEFRHIPPTSMRLSHVCRFWRDIALLESYLWRYVPVYPESSWTQSKLNWLRSFRRIIPNYPTLILDLSRYDQRGNSRYSPFGGSVPMREEYTSLVDIYSLILVSSGQGRDPDLSSWPFRQPTAITLQFLSSPTKSFGHLLTPFTGFTSLEVIYYRNYPAAALPLATAQPQLTILRLNLATFQHFDLTECLGPDLKELHITHHGSSILPRLAKPATLSKLQVLGLMASGTDFFQSLQLPSLGKMVLYGPKTGKLSTDMLIQFPNHPNFTQVRELELRGWGFTDEDVRICWSEQEDMFDDILPSQIDITDILNTIATKMVGVATLRFTKSKIYKGTLGFIRTLKDAKDKLGGWKLQTLIFDGCLGVTREDHDALLNLGLVEKIEVYV